ncbi:lysosomal acid glucosylceramidase-like [Physella acuta]|uniref:lysosomal acid glucosylceramidase-like n=1 Tax=Physella acuta TaxID=109671 RepID=UPI0027DB1E1A|nr:lysosomal acid glucosylceramidase-like [Physella acuta]
MAASMKIVLFLFKILSIYSFNVLYVKSDVPCAPLYIRPQYMVCVCNSTYCDTAPSAEKVPKGQFLVITTSQSGLRFQKQILQSSSVPKTNVTYSIKLNVTRQTILGFGGAFTDAAGINIAALPDAAQELLINSYYSNNGLEYTIGRVPMASCDFSTHPYSYDDVPGDLNLTKFSLAPEDIKYKIPYIQKAIKAAPVPIKLFASPWSAPAWMKTNNNMTGKGSLIGQPGGPYYKAWANYFVKFLQEYEKNSIQFWGITAQNEPSDGLEFKFPFQAMGFTPEQQRDFIKMDLGPALHSAGYGNISLMILDDVRIFIITWAKIVLSDPEASRYISGVATHWYLDAVLPYSLLTDAHNLFPDKFLFATEACEGSMPWQVKVDLGAWDRAASYAHDIISDLNNWVTGWTDWNLALDMQGGPNWVANNVDSPIIVNSAKKEFYKQPMFYILGHFSKYIVPGSVWLGTKPMKENPLIEITSFLRPDKSLAVTVLNLGFDAVNLDLTDGISGFMPISVPGHSIQTVIWWL